MTARAYYVHGVELVGTDGLCEACEQRPAVGRSIAGHRVCARCAGMAAVMADELAQEIEASKRRRERDRPQLSVVPPPTPKRPVPVFRCGHASEGVNVYTNPTTGWHSCRQCRRIQQAAARRSKVGL